MVQGGSEVCLGSSPSTEAVFFSSSFFLSHSICEMFPPSMMDPISHLDRCSSHQVLCSFAHSSRVLGEPPGSTALVSRTHQAGLDVLGQTSQADCCGEDAGDGFF